MDNVEVTTRYDRDGKVIPLQVSWQGQVHGIESVGRQWVDEQGQHILIMLADGRVVELLFDRLTDKWYLIPRDSGRSLA